MSEAQLGDPGDHGYDDYHKLRAAVAKLQADGLAPEKSQELSFSPNGEKSPDRKGKLNLALLKQEAGQVLTDELAKFKGTATGVLKILMGRVSKELKGTMDHLQLDASEINIKQYLQNFLFVFLSAELGGLGAIVAGAENLLIPILGMFVGGAIGANMSYRFTRLIDKLQPQKTTLSK